MIINFKNYMKESFESSDGIIRIMPMDIRKKYDNEFKNGKYKGKNINIIYDYVSRRKHQYSYDEINKIIRNGGKIPKILGWKETHNFFDKNQEYLKHMKSLLLGKRVGYYDCGDKIKDNYYYIIPIVKRVEFNTFGMLVVAGGGGFFGPNPGIGGHFGGPIDERMPLDIIEPKIIISDYDPFGEEDWNY